MYRKRRAVGFPAATDRDSSSIVTAIGHVGGADTVRVLERLAWLLFPLCLGVMAWLAPLPKLFTYEVYRGPQSPLRDQPVLFHLYSAALVVLALLYLGTVLVPVRRPFKGRGLLGLFVAMILLAAVSYPVVYDPLAYHYDTLLWLQKGVNVYTDRIEASKQFGFPVVAFPIYHNYHRGPVWLLVCALLFTVSGGLFVGFLTLLRLVAVAALAGVVRVLKGWFRTDLSREQLLFFLGFNPIVLIYLLNSGLQEALLALLLLASFAFALKKRPFLAGLFLAIALFDKVSVWPLLPLVGAWLLGNQPDTRGRLRTISMMAAGGLVVAIPLYLIFGFSPAYLSGVETWTAKEHEKWAVLSGSIIMPLVHLGLDVDRDLARALLRPLFVGIEVGLVGVYSFQLLRGARFETLVRGSWLVLILSPYLADVGLRPWYLLPALFFAPLLGPAERRLTAIVTSLAVLGGSMFGYILLTHGQPRLLINDSAAIVIYLIPTLLLLWHIVRTAEPLFPPRPAGVSLPLEKTAAK